MKTPRNAATAPHTTQEYHAVAHTAYRMLAGGCGRKGITKFTGIPDAHVQKMMTTAAGKAQVAALIEKSGRPVDREKIDCIQTGEMGPEKFAEGLISGRVRLRVSQQQLDVIVKDHAQSILQNRK